ncbi:unnamed protein product [Arctia plantaginis]|uniref:Uncharacterized protein n=1 Tax=Arctia plantaginis TaxID=874455 RepID=A0A8S0YXM5_ARCPL|nr:unnamed protein product [Arctia plantaginis]
MLRAVGRVLGARVGKALCAWASRARVHTNGDTALKIELRTDSGPDDAEPDLSRTPPSLQRIPDDPIRHFVDPQTVADNNLGLDGKDIVVNILIFKRLQHLSNRKLTTNLKDIEL